MIYTDLLALRAIARLSASIHSRRHLDALDNALSAIELSYDADGNGSETGCAADAIERSAAQLVRRSTRLLAAVEPGESAHANHLVQLQTLQSRFALQAHEASLLDHLAHCQMGGALQSLMTSIDVMGFYTSDARVMGLMATILNVGSASLRRSLYDNAAIIENGLATIDADGECRMSSRVTTWFAQSSGGSEVSDIAACLLGRPVDATLQWEEVSSHVDGAPLLQRMLLGALDREERGINVLIHGSPGTGKTEFVKSLACSIGVPLFLAAESDEYGAEPTRSERLASLKLSDRLLGGRQALLMADEADDVLGAEGMDLARLFGARRVTGTGSKVYLNRLLETNRCPVIWVLNDAAHLPNTILRRMSVVIEMNPPPLGVRQRIWNDAASTNRLTGIEQTLARCAGDARLSPAIAHNAMRTVSLAGGTADQDLKQVISGLVSLIAPRADSSMESASVSDGFDADRINCRSPDWALLRELQGCRETLRQSPLSILISGVPGTGKSLYARQLGEQLAMPVHLLRPSDVLSPMVGESEQQLAAAFRQAIRDQSLLVIDEVDSFLSGRRADSKTWERTLVNELLTHLERHSIPIVCTTNHLECIDQAALRRFLFQLRFDPMTRTQSVSAINAQWGVSISCREVPDGLVPADIARVDRRYTVLGIIPNAERVLKDLGAISAARGGTQGSIGFVSTHAMESSHGAV